MLINVLFCGLVSGIRCLECADDLNKLHDGYRVHKMHAYNFIRSFGETGKFGDGYRWSISSDDRLRFEYFIKRTEYRLLDIDIFDNGLNYPRCTSTTKSTYLLWKLLISSVYDSLLLNYLIYYSVIRFLESYFDSQSDTKVWDFLRETGLES